MSPPTVTLARNAMATRFELVLHGENPVALRAAGEAALDEIERLENQMSLYRPGSEIAQLNARAAREAVRVTPELFALLRQAQRLHAETCGAFDITVAPLVRCWGFMGGQGGGFSDQSDKSDGSGRSDGEWRPPTDSPSRDAVTEARSKVGMHHLLLHPAERTVSFARDGVMLDLGAIGKGYAVERAAEILREAGVKSALLHGGTSTVCAIGSPPGAEFWNVALESPPEWERQVAFRRVSNDGQPQAEAVLDAPLMAASIHLRDEALSVSAIRGRCFESGGKTFGHVIDPGTGRPVENALLAAVVLRSATETDALSTALLTLGGAGLDRLARIRPGLRALILSREAGKLTVAGLGLPDFALP